MRDGLAAWVRDANNVHQFSRFADHELAERFLYLRARADDYYIALVSELFERLRTPYEDREDWARLANAIAQCGAVFADAPNSAGQQTPSDTAMLSAIAFYAGGYSASAYVTLKSIDRNDLTEVDRACFELLAKPLRIESETVTRVLAFVREGNFQGLNVLIEEVAEKEAAALDSGPAEWVPLHFLTDLLRRFQLTNIRSVLPDGQGARWSPLVESLIDRRPPVWDFFPSQIEAIEAGFLESQTTFSLQMPTGAGKTALTETLLFDHLSSHPAGVAILLVPFRSLASELKSSLARRLTKLGFITRSIYGGSIPSQEEIDAFGEVRAIIATPEAMLGVLAADPTLAAKVTLVVCDEGHLLDGGSRGVALELLLARFLVRPAVPRRFVFISAIVPNIEEINAWLGGNNQTVVRSEYKPTLAEYALLSPNGRGAAKLIGLILHPHLEEGNRYREPDFLTAANFTYIKQSTGRTNVYPYSSIKAQAIASARKALSMGAVAVFSANKKGPQGAIGLAEELIKQLELPLDLPAPPLDMRGGSRLSDAIEFLTLEFGANWVGTRALSVGAVLHHGDVPQESREVLEGLLRSGDVAFAICTNTLAEGVNLPIRTLVLYSVQRRTRNGAVNLLGRDIKNLVGRAGRAGSETKGLVICANPAQWDLVRPVALQEAGERVGGALLSLVTQLQLVLVQRDLQVTDQLLEDLPWLHELTDGVDAILVELAAEELADGRLEELALEICANTFASTNADEPTRATLREVFSLRSRRVMDLQRDGRLPWVRESGARLRLLDQVESGLLPMATDWTAFSSPVDPQLVETLITWAWALPDVMAIVNDELPSALTLQVAIEVVQRWLNAASFDSISQGIEVDVDDLLRLQTRLLGYTLQVNIEQGVALLAQALASREILLPTAVYSFPEHLRLGVPSTNGRELLNLGMRHRRIAAALGESIDLSDSFFAFLNPKSVALAELQTNESRWISEFGETAYRDSVADLI